VIGLYYPSLVVNLILRFDEALLPAASLTPQSAASLAESPVVLPKTGKDTLTQVLGIVPKSCSVELPAYRQAGKFTINMEYKDFPIDPRILRAASAEVHLGTVSAEAFGLGVAQRAAGRRSSIIDTRTAGGGIRQDTLLILGYVDSISAEHTTSGSMVSMEGRDPRGVLLDVPAPAAVVSQLKLDREINAVVEQVLEFHPILKAHPPKVIINEDDWEEGVPFVSDEDKITRINKGAKGKKTKLPAKGGADSLNFWDLITQFCALCGAVPFFAGDGLHIRRARSLYDQKKAGLPGNPTPFKGGAPRTITSTSGRSELRVRRLVYGRDVASFKLDRKIQGAGKRPTIEVVSMDTGAETRGAGRVVTARWPKAPAKTSVTPEGDTAQEEILRIPVSGILDKAKLENLARDIYEEVGRGELGGSVSTKDLASFGGDNQDPDLLHIRPGDALEVVAAANLPGGRAPIVSELTTHNARTQAEEVAALTKRLGDATLAQVLASATSAVGKLQTIFRVSTVRFSWDAGTGVGLDFDFQNYVEARV